MTLSDLELDCTSKYLSTAVKKVRIAMSVVGHHLLLMLFVMNLHVWLQVNKKKEGWPRNDILSKYAP